MTRLAKYGGALRSRLHSFGYTLEPATAPRLALVADPVLRLIGRRLQRYAPHPGFGYIAFAETAAAAHAAGLSIPAYVARLWDEEGLTESIVDRLAECVPFHECRHIVEIGPGTGRTLEIVMARSNPELYEIYEPDAEWAAHLVQRYGVLNRYADGVSLTPTATASCDLAHAHGVFVYLPLVNAFKYFDEMIRVVRPGGWIVFDLFADASVTLPVVQEWTRSGQGFHILLPRQALLELFAERGCVLVQEFDVTEVHCQYMIFRRNG